MPSRRQFLTAIPAAAIAHSAAVETTTAAPQSDLSSSNRTPRIRTCLNTSTVRGHNLTITEQVDLAAAVGYDGIEPWIGDIRKFVAAGGRLEDLKRRINNAGLRVESAIGFAKWIVDDAEERETGVNEFRSDMELVAAIGGSHIAAPPVGMHRGDAPELNLDAAAERYHAVLEVGRDVGVTPQLEFWGPSKNLSKLEQAMYVASAAGHPDACLLPDIYHLFRGGSSFSGLGMLAGGAVHCFHINDYPGDKPRESYIDADRIYPGAGVAPIAEVLKTLIANGFSGALSLELFNKDYWKEDATSVAEKGLESIRNAISAATVNG